MYKRSLWTYMSHLTEILCPLTNVSSIPYHSISGNHHFTLFLNRTILWFVRIYVCICILYVFVCIYFVYIYVCMICMYVWFVCKWNYFVCKCLFFCAWFISMSILLSRFIYVTKITELYFVKGQILFYCVCKLYFLCPFIHWWTHKLVPYLGYCK